jgi:hypothetical protein
MDYEIQINNIFAEGCMFIPRMACQKKKTWPGPSAKKEGTYLSQTGGEVAKVSCINKILPTFFTDFDRCI